MSDKSVVQKLFLRENNRFMLLNAPPGYRESLGALPAGVEVTGEISGEADVIQVFATMQEDLQRQIAGLKNALIPKGILWVTYPKGGSKIRTDLNRDILFALLQPLGLQAVAMFAVDADWSAMRFKKI